MPSICWHVVYRFTERGPFWKTAISSPRSCRCLLLWRAWRGARIIMMPCRGRREAESSAGPEGTVRARGSRPWPLIFSLVSGSIAATEVSEWVIQAGERTVRRYLAEMVREGKLISVLRGRSMTYRAGNSTDSLGGNRWARLCAGNASPSRSVRVVSEGH